MHSLAKFHLRRRLGLDNTFLAPAAWKPWKMLSLAKVHVKRQLCLENFK